jgi:hypothetical protein
MLRTSRIKGGRRKAEGGFQSERSLCADSFPLPPSPFRPRTAITLIEVLISMFVLLFGLMGVAAIFPVASHYVLEGDKRDRSSGLAQIAFEELKSRKLLRPKEWVYPSNINTTAGGTLFISPGPSFPSYFGEIFDPGIAFVLDPLASAIPVTGSDQTLRTAFPAKANNNRNLAPGGWPTLRYPVNPGVSTMPMPLTYWPVRRLSLDVNPHVTNNTVMSAQTAETAFRLRDDLVTQQPKAGDRPSVQRWRKTDPNNTPTNPNDDVMLSREYVGDYSWLATVVPTRQTALLGLQPAAGYRDEFYEVTSVVFYKRDITPSVTTGGSAGSERLIGAEFLNSGELALYDYDTNTTNETVDTALDGIKPTNWIAVCGVNQVTGAFMLKWYKVLAMDDSNDRIQSPNPTPNANNQMGRHLMVDGPEWPTSSYTNLRAIIVPGAIDAYTQIMQLTNISTGPGELVVTQSAR